MLGAGPTCFIVRMSYDTAVLEGTVGKYPRLQSRLAGHETDG